MLDFITIWKLLAGIAFFLWGMQSIEEALGFLSSRKFKLFLKKLSQSRILSVLGGALASLVMQSSSLVNTMILAFVTNKVIQIPNALALILGSNLGTTFNSWIFVFVGFKVEFENLAFALAGIFGFILYLSKPGHLLHAWSKFLFSIGVILIGLNLIKTGMDQTTANMDLSQFNEYPGIVFLLIGLALTALLQASSATLIIVLSALNVEAISLLAGMAVVLGAEIGTTLKFLLASVKGIPDKKRVAVGNTAFNVVIALIVLTLLKPIDHLIQDVIGLKDPLISVVFFQSLVNIIAILIFTPFLHPISLILGKLFTKAHGELLNIQKINLDDTQKAMSAMEEDVHYFMLCTLRFTQFSFKLPVDQRTTRSFPKIFKKKNDLEQYEYLKILHGEIHEYGFKLLSAGKLDKKEEIRLQQILNANRNTLYAAKNIKDAFDDLHALRESSNEVKFDFYTHTSKQMKDFMKAIHALLKDRESASLKTDLKTLYQSLPETYNEILHQLYKDDLESKLNGTEISTLMNFNREMYSALKSFVFAVKDYLLTEEEANYFDELPGFIR